MKGAIELGEQIVLLGKTVRAIKALGCHQCTFLNSGPSAIDCPARAELVLKHSLNCHVRSFITEEQFLIRRLKGEL